MISREFTKIAIRSQDRPPLDVLQGQYRMDTNSIKGMRLILVALVFVTAPAWAQEEMTRYTASNGLVIAEGDSVTIGVGAVPGGTYRHIFMSSLISPLRDTYIEYCRTTYPLAAGQEGATVPVKKIRKANGVVYVFVPLGGSTPFIIEVEEAINTCELAFCRPEGYLTQEEFSKLILINQAAADNVLTEGRYYELRKEFMEPPIAEPEHLE